MSINPSPPLPLSDTQQDSPPSGIDVISQNIETILEFYTREEQKTSRSERALASLSGFLGRPPYLGFVLLFVVLWMLAEVLERKLGWDPFDPPPFIWLQGIVSLAALVMTTIVLITQNRQAKLEEQRAHLELQVNLLTEQKTTKLINLIEELRRDLPMVKDRHDPEAAALQQPTDPHRVLAAIDERREATQASAM